MSQKVSRASENMIVKYAPQDPISYRSEKAKVEYLYNYVIRLELAKLALTQSNANCAPLPFQQLYAALDSAWIEEQRHSKTKPKTVV